MDVKNADTRHGDVTAQDMGASNPGDREDRDGASIPPAPADVDGDGAQVPGPADGEELADELEIPSGADADAPASVKAGAAGVRGDGEPAWTQVWSHIGLGKIFDLTGQRDRAVQEYRLAVQTNDNTQGAVNEARLLLQKPFERQRTMD